MHCHYVMPFTFLFQFDGTMPPAGVDPTSVVSARILKRARQPVPEIQNILVPCQSFSNVILIATCVVAVRHIMYGKLAVGRHVVTWNCRAAHSINTILYNFLEE